MHLHPLRGTMTTRIPQERNADCPRVYVRGVPFNMYREHGLIYLSHPWISPLVSMGRTLEEAEHMAEVDAAADIADGVFEDFAREDVRWQDACWKLADFTNLYDEDGNCQCSTCRAGRGEFRA